MRRRKRRMRVKKRGRRNMVKQHGLFSGNTILSVFTHLGKKKKRGKKKKGETHTPAALSQRVALCNLAHPFPRTGLSSVLSRQSQTPIGVFRLHPWIMSLWKHTHRAANKSWLCCNKSRSWMSHFYYFFPPLIPGHLGWFRQTFKCLITEGVGPRFLLLHCRFHNLFLLYPRLCGLFSKHVYFKLDPRGQRIPPPHSHPHHYHHRDMRPTLIWPLCNGTRVRVSKNWPSCHCK